MVTTELSIHPEDPVSSKTVRREPHKSNNYGKATISKRLIEESKAKRQKRWCEDHKTWGSDDWKYAVCSDESLFTLFPTTVWVYIPRMPKEAYKSECLIPTVKYGGGSVIIWAAKSCYSAGPIILEMVDLLPVITWTF